MADPVLVGREVVANQATELRRVTSVGDDPQNRHPRRTPLAPQGISRRVHYIHYTRGVYDTD
jgi:hypothetical protein